MVVGFLDSALWVVRMDTRDEVCVCIYMSVFVSCECEVEGEKSPYPHSHRALRFRTTLSYSSQ